MSYWGGLMNWALDPEWKCKTCGNAGLRMGLFAITGFTWGIVNGVFRCNNCHTQYSLREGRVILITPLCRLKEEYKEPAKTGWKQYHTPIDTWDDDCWDELMKGEG